MAEAEQQELQTDSSLVAEWLPRGLLVAAIWGIAVFLWGTFGAWTHRQYTDVERLLGKREVASVSAWLDNAVSPLDRLADDNRIGPAMELPAGVESLPVQRVLYEYSYLAKQTEIYLVDILRKRVGRTAGTAPLSADTVERLSKLPQEDKLVLGMGLRNGQMFLVRRVKAPLPNHVVAMIPVSLMTLASSQPSSALPEGRKLAFIVPHAAGWALWKDGDQGFTLSNDMNEIVRNGRDEMIAEGTISVITPVPQWPEVKVVIQSPNEVGGARILPQLLVGLWAVMMTFVALWKPLEPARQRLGARIGPMMAPIVAPLGKLATTVVELLESMGGRMKRGFQDGIKDEPLVDGPGAFAQHDFLTASELAQRTQPRKPRMPVRPSTFGHATAVKERRKSDRRKADRPGSSDRRRDKLNENAAMAAWQKAADLSAPPAAKKEAAEETKIDVNNMHAVVEDALKKRRIKLLYQPIYRASDNTPVMHEVYARLMKPDGTIVTPDVFLPIAAELKITLQLDLQVLRKVVHDHFGNGSPLTPLALNISSTSLDGLAYLQELAGLGPRVLQRVSFEVNSQEMIRDPKALRLLKDIQKHGGNLSVDYFGGGTAMLDASMAMGFNCVKMNGAKLASTEESKKEMIRLCQHARGIGLPIVMEMVGDAKTQTFARRAGAEFLQGYALARPSEHMTIEPLPPELTQMQNVAQL